MNKECFIHGYLFRPQVQIVLAVYKSLVPKDHGTQSAGAESFARSLGCLAESCLAIISVSTYTVYYYSLGDLCSLSNI